MNILLFGAGGFLGKKLTEALCKEGKIALNGQSPQDIQRLVLFDWKLPAEIIQGPNVEVIEGDICNQNAIRNLLAQPFDVIFHLAAIVSGEAEKNFDLGMNVNLHATLHMLECCREFGHKPVFVFASSCGVFGGELDETIYDSTAARPRSSYGTQKAIGDLLVSDFSRRGFIDGRSLRLPTIAIRPGKPNAATSTFVSSIIREPLQGQSANCPVDPDTRVWILSPRKVTACLLHAAALSADQLGHTRIINLPGTTTTIQEMVNCMVELGGSETANRIDWEPDAFIQSIVLTWPPQFETRQAIQLGFPEDESVEAIIQAFMEDDMVR